ncbi:EAL domain, c-di-GMP-specific phosphodiesterase class I (or its enzymatically inactive variant) [Halopseudomonas xinjiangensis]|uniref:EAL domain, c-di-GMP-specific phosphodiesterase class I (Or its enzymatically inactive variant) n=1 Tax=Halopseudomonas xinjiangensis TaxID=487184 RepID=A0A1H1SFU3_9GAMM|nr:EAL domain-containing protein [Halopseudomonas xinjiangensis]SDS46950.1 EAL domain, c-di-GMP-specific phosphodiesterase class I (or its enzymatically inactive variant) [Halopseudomonas xinjiangensis]
MIDGHALPYFQPLIDTATGRIAGYEALARLRDDNGDVRSAGPLFTDPQVDPDDLLELDRTIRRMALESFRDNPAGFLSLNISPLWVSRLEPGTPLPSLALMAEIGLPPEQVVFEITELQGDIHQLKDVVQRYRQAGIRIAIDDFGAGYSMLDRVLALEPDILKLDIQLFRKAASGTGNSGDFVRALALMAEKSGCWIIAEGVETEAELHFALECGARYVQGYLFARPEENFLPDDAVQAKFSTMRDHYVSEKLAERAKLATLRRSLAQLFAELREWLATGAQPTRLPSPKRYPWLIRCFLCDAHGTQISPNYEWIDRHWRADPRYLDHNWSWRPYFYQILAEAGEDSRVILSNRYRDATTNQYCMTSGLFIDDSRHLLLVDIDIAHI